MTASASAYRLVQQVVSGTIIATLVLSIQLAILQSVVGTSEIVGTVHRTVEIKQAGKKCLGTANVRENAPHQRVNSTLETVWTLTVLFLCMFPLERKDWQ